MRIIFMGTPDFAVPSLRELHDRGHEIALVVSQPDRPAGRGRKLTPPPVKAAALDLGLPVDQPDTVNSESFLAKLRAIEPELIVVAAFGQILRETLLELPSLGAVNVHASLLPAYRGVAPINWVIVNGERETGVTTMFMARKVDAGEIILTRKTPIGDAETAGELSDRLAAMGALLLAETVDLIGRGEAPRLPQDPERASYARKLRKDDGEIDWSRSSREVFDHIRGMTPRPGAYTWYRGRSLVITRAERGSACGGPGAPGEIVAIDDESGIEVAVADGTVRLLEVKPEGRRAMDAVSFARGYRPEVGAAPFGKPS